MRLRSTTVFLAALLVAVLPPRAGAQDALFSKTYVRLPGPPVTVTDAFEACDPAGRFSLVVENGPGGTPRASSASIAVNGVEVVGPSDFNQQVERIERPLLNVAAANEIAVRLASRPEATILVSVLGTQSCGMEITSPADGSTVSGPEVLVEGTFPASFGPDVGVTVNGATGLASAGRFAALVPVDPSVTSLTAVAKNAAGVTLDDDTIAVTVQAGPDERGVAMRATPRIGVAPLTTELKLVSTVPVSRIDLDQDGDGDIDFQGVTLDGLFTYPQPGVYAARATVTGAAGVHVATAVVQVYDRAALEALLQAKWSGMRDALRRGDIDAALQFIVASARDRYRVAFEALVPDLPQIDTILTGLTFVRAWGAQVTFEMQRLDAGVQKSFEVRFGLDEDGVWRLGAF